MLRATQHNWFTSVFFCVRSQLESKLTSSSCASWMIPTPLGWWRSLDTIGRKTSHNRIQCGMWYIWVLPYWFRVFVPVAHSIENALAELQAIECPVCKVDVPHRHEGSSKPGGFEIIETRAMEADENMENVQLALIHSSI